MHDERNMGEGRLTPDTIKHPVCVCVCVCVCERVHAQSCSALCNPVDCSLPGPSVHGIFQARILE